MPLDTFTVVTIFKATAGGAQSIGFINVSAGVASMGGTPVPLPTAITSTYSFIRSLPSDRAIVYIAGIPIGTGYCKIWRFNGHTSTFTELLSVEGNNNYSCPIELCFLPEGETVYAAVGTWNTRAQSFGQHLPEDSVAGVYKSVGGSPFIQQGSGHQYGFNGGNINHPNTLTSMCIVLGTPNKLVTTHCQTPSNDPFSQSVMDVSTDDGVTWTAVAATPALVTGYEYWCLTQLQWHPEWSTQYFSFGADISGVGAYALPQQSGLFIYPPTLILMQEEASNLLSGAMIAFFFDGSGDGIMFDTNGFLHVYQAINHGVSYNEIIPETTGLGAGWRSFAVHDSQPTGLIGYEGLTGADGRLVFTTDGGAHFTQFTPPSYSILAVDFGVGSEPVSGGIFPQSATFRDARGFIGRTLTYLDAPDNDTARTYGEAIVGAIASLSTARFEQAAGPWTTSPIEQLPGPGGTYNTVEIKAVIAFGDTNGGVINVEIPAPAAAIFAANGEDLDPTNAGLIDAVATILANNLCGRGGFLANSWLGGRRVQRRTRRRMNVYTLNPEESGPGQ